MNPYVARRGGTWALVVLLVVVMLALPALAHHQRTQHVNRTAKGWPLAPFVLQDHQGAPLTEARLRGQWTFVLLGDTRCGAPCAEVLGVLAGVRQRIARTEALKTTQVIFLSLDPAHDTPGQLRSYLAEFEPAFIGATGPEAVLRQVVDDLALARDTAQAANDHRGALVLIGPDAMLRVEYLPPYDIKLLTADYMITRSRR
ncbi:MAG TPA: SCO family protein [Ideonella sp.]|nr:SCO family protein [Ideonella sp.]